MKVNKMPFLAYLCLLPILIALGIWQLNRAEEKRMLLALQSQHQITDALWLTGELPELSDSLLYKPVKAEGRYDDKHQFLLDNQINKGRAGYFIVTPFVLRNTDKAVLVNRGWLPLGGNRSNLPDIRVDNSETVVKGRINRFPSVGLKLAGAEIPSDNWPALVQVIDAKVLAKKLGYPLVDFQIELDKTADNGYAREWQEFLVMTPEKHIGYAVQWFLLAITLTILFIKYGIKKDHD